MSITDWFRAREEKRYTELGSAAVADAGSSAEAWVKCESCKRVISESELAEDLRVCKYCGNHFSLTAPERILLLSDAGSFLEIDAGLESGQLDLILRQCHRINDLRIIHQRSRDFLTFERDDFRRIDVHRNSLLARTNLVLQRLSLGAINVLCIRHASERNEGCKNDVHEEFEARIPHGCFPYRRDRKLLSLWIVQS